MTKLLIALLYWEGDQKEVERLGRLLADLLEEPTDQAEILFVGRYDAKPVSVPTQIHCRQKFEKVGYWQCNRKGEGFPGGCNELAYGIFNHVLTQRHLGHSFKDIDAILILEGDVVVTRRTWLQELIAAWQAARLIKDMWIVGAKQPELPEWHTKEHINAVALYDKEITRLLPCLIGGPQHIGWDNYHGPKMIPHAIDSPLFYLDYRCPTITAEELFKEGFPLIYHGVKDDSAYNAVRERYELK